MYMAPGRDMAADDEPTTSSNITQQCNTRTNSSSEEPTTYLHWDG